MAMPLAKTPQALYNNADPEVIRTVLLHKINRAAEAEGLAEARGLLQDWLVTLTARYNQRVAKRLKPDQTLDVSVVPGVHCFLAPTAFSCVAHCPASSCAA